MQLLSIVTHLTCASHPLDIPQDLCQDLGTFAQARGSQPRLLLLRDFRRTTSFYRPIASALIALSATLLSKSGPRTLGIVLQVRDQSTEVTDSFSKFGLGQDSSVSKFPFNFCDQLIDDRHFFFETDFEPFFRRAAPQATFFPT